jgi:predicted ATP-dependent serine protease
MRELYKNSTLVTISQSTKKGQLRGSQEIEHESDISLKVEDGFAFATKNRFKELGYEYSIFENYS